MESSLRGEKVTGKTHTEINFIVNDYTHWRVRQRVKYERKSRHRYHVYANSPRRNGRARRNGQHPFPHLSHRRVCLYTGSLHWPGSVYTHAELFSLTRPYPSTHVPPLLVYSRQVRTDSLFSRYAGAPSRSTASISFFGPLIIDLPSFRALIAPNPPTLVIASARRSSCRGSM